MQPDQPTLEADRCADSTCRHRRSWHGSSCAGDLMHCGCPEFVEPHAFTRADVDAAYQRGLAEGQAGRDQLRRLHEATEAALEQAEQYARDLQDDGGAYGLGYDACAAELNDKVIREIKRAHHEGIAEGRRQATKGWEREWGVAHGPGRLPDRGDDEVTARRLASYSPERRVVSRLVGPWETAERPSVKHASPNCGCGINDAGQRFTDPICREQ
jgi:hypothetical protein